MRALRASPSTRAAALCLLAAASLASACYRPATSPGGLLMQRAGGGAELYADPAFDLRALERDGVAVLNAHLPFGNETLGAPMVRGLVTVLRERLSEESVLHPSELASRINAAGLARDYGDMLSSYATTGILEKATLGELEGVVGTRYFGMPVLLSFQEAQSSRLSAFGLRIGKTASASARFDLQIWDARTGRIVWEGSSDLTIAQEVVREGPISLEETVYATWRSLVEQMPPTRGRPAELR